MQAVQLSHPAVARYYQALVIEEGTAWIPMLNVVETLSTKDYAQTVIAFTTHDALGISNSRNSIFVSYHPASRFFIISYRDVLTRKESRIRCEHFEVVKLVDSLALRLTLQGEPEKETDGSDC